MKKIRKAHAFTLLEILLSFTLAALISWILLSSFKNLSVSNNEMSKLQGKIHQQNCSYLRLTQIFENLKLAENAKKNVWTEGGKLHCTFFQHIDREAALCGVVEGSIYLNGKKELAVQIKAANGSQREEILLENIDRVEFSFFDRKLKTWHSIWTGEPLLYPSIIKMEITASRAVQKMHFFILAASAPISLTTMQAK